MKKLFCFVLFLITTTVFSQGIVKARGVGFIELTTAQRDALSVPSGEKWQIYNVTTGQYEYWDGDSWEPFPAGAGGGSTAASISYDNTISGLSATNVKLALDELDQAIEDINFIDGTYLETDNNGVQSVIGTVDFNLPRASQGIMRFDRSAATISGEVGYNTFGINSSGQWFLGKDDTNAGAYFDVSSLTASRVFNLPDNGGTLALTTDILSGLSAENVSFNNVTSGMSATTVQAALDELSDVKISSDNTGLTGAQVIDNFVAINQADFDNLTAQQQTESLFLITDGGAVGSTNASNVSFTPYLTITSTDVQNALQEIKDEIDAGAGGGISNLVEDLTPQLGGNLDMNGFEVTGQLVVNNDIAVDDVLIVKGAATQSGNLLEFQNDAGTDIGHFNSNGIYSKDQTLGSALVGTSGSLVGLTVNSGNDFTIQNQFGTEAMGIDDLGNITFNQPVNFTSNAAMDFDVPTSGSFTTTLDLEPHGKRYVNGYTATTSFSTSASPRAGAWCKVAFNTTSQPTVTGATYLSNMGAAWETGTNMWMIVFTDDGTNIEYFFLKK